MIEKATVVGMGMMGASFALALKKAGLVHSVCGVDVQSACLDTALQRGIIDRGSRSLATGIEAAELVVLATPVCAVMQLLPELAALHYSGMVIDLGSTKQKICEIAGGFPDLPFVGCHPMAGCEIAGIDGANGALFNGAPVIITPNTATDRQLLCRVRKLWEGLESRITIMDAEEHDFAVAIISHLPYLAAVMTMNTAAELAQHNPDIFRLIAGGFRDTTRVSEGDPVMWRDICLTNRTHILTVIAKYRTLLDNLEHTLETADACQLQEIFLTSQRHRRKYISLK